MQNAIRNQENLETTPSETKAALEPEIDVSEPEPATQADPQGGSESKEEIEAADDPAGRVPRSEQSTTDDASDGQPARLAEAADPAPAVLDSDQENPILLRSEKPEES